MTLALRLGRTLSELMATITASELRLWMEFDRLSPIGDARGDIHAALISSATAQAQGHKVSMSDFMPRWGEADEEKDDSADIEAFFSKLSD